jgi:uncharacterized membrane protein
MGTSPARHDGEHRSRLDENVEVIKRWERDALHNRSRAEQIAERVTRDAASGMVLLFHAIWFASWLLANAGMLPGVQPFDPFPFPLLTLVVSLEAIVLTLFVLSSQNRLSQQADKRAHLDLQINLLAEQEMTIVLRLLQDISAHLKAPVSVTPAQIRDLTKKTDVHAITDRLDEIQDPSAEQPASGTASA